MRTPLQYITIFLYIYIFGKPQTVISSTSLQSSVQYRAAMPPSPWPTWCPRTPSWTRTPGGSTSPSSPTCSRPGAPRPSCWSAPSPPRTTGSWRTRWSASTSRTTCGTPTAAWTTTAGPFWAAPPRRGTRRTTGWRSSRWTNWENSSSSSPISQ